MNIHRVYAPISRHFRRRRMAEFCRTFSITPETHVLDVGGSRFNWDLAPVRPRVTFLNLEPAPRHALDDGDAYVQGSALALPYADQSVDLLYSNSVIEHVGDWTAQQQFAREVRRVARRYYVQTPNRWFPVEPHLLGVGIHWLPTSWQPHLVRYGSVWGLVTKPSPERVRAMLADMRLLTGREMRRLFPDAAFGTERAAGLVKSLVAAHQVMSAEERLSSM